MLSPEEQLLTDFFEAARVFDTSVMSRLSDVPMNPRTDGIVDSFEIGRIEERPDGTERVTGSARVRALDGRLSQRQFVVTLGRRDGRRIIQRWEFGGGTS